MKDRFKMTSYHRIISANSNQ